MQSASRKDFVDFVAWLTSTALSDVRAARGDLQATYPRDFLGNRFVYAVVSPRAGGLSIGVNMNPDKKCNFDCLYCEVDRTEPARASRLTVRVMAAELKRTIAAVHAGRLRERPLYCNFPSIHGAEPSQEEITHYVRQLEELKAAGAQIALVQVYSATRPMPNSGCGHLPLKGLSHIAQTVREATGLKAEVF